MGGHRDLKHLAEGLIQQGHAAALGLHQDPGLHVLDEGAEATRGDAEDNLGVLPGSDVVQGAGHPLDHPGLVVGDALVGLHPLHVPRPGGNAELPLEEGLPRVHRVGEHIQVAGVVRGMEAVQEGLLQALGHRDARELRPGGVQEGPVALPIDAEDHFLQIFHQGSVAVGLGLGHRQPDLQGEVPGGGGEAGVARHVHPSSAGSSRILKKDFLFFSLFPPY